MKKHDGASERDHAESAARQFAALGIKRPMPAAAEASELPPPGTEHLWRWFLEISEGLEGNGFGPALVTWQALANWCALTKTQLDPWEARALVRLGVARAVAAARSKPASG